MWPFPSLGFHGALGLQNELRRESDGVKTVGAGRGMDQCLTGISVLPMQDLLAGPSAVLPCFILLKASLFTVLYQAAHLCSAECWLGKEFQRRPQSLPTKACHGKWKSDFPISKGLGYLERAGERQQGSDILAPTRYIWNSVREVSTCPREVPYLQKPGGTWRGSGPT